MNELLYTQNNALDYLHSKMTKKYCMPYEGFPAISTLVRKICEQIITPPFHFDPLPTQVPKPQYRLRDSESAIILAQFFGDLAPTDPFV